jgi:hypothetical protein
MSNLSSSMEYRQQIAELVARAVPESDPERRRQLLEQADHWGRLLRSQRQTRPAGEPRSFQPERAASATARNLSWLTYLRRDRQGR